jgi:oxalate decarboxylase
MPIKVLNQKEDGVTDIGKQDTKVSRREMFELGSAALAAATLTVAAPGCLGAIPQERHPENHNAPNETDPGPRNLALAKENPNSVWPPETDHGSVKPFKYSFALSHKRIESGGWTRQVTARDLAISKDIAGVEMRLTAGGVREFHWHVEAEWAIMLYGNARITAVDHEARSFVSDVGEATCGSFPREFLIRFRAWAPMAAGFGWCSTTESLMSSTRSSLRIGSRTLRRKCWRKISMCRN